MQYAEIGTQSTPSKPVCLLPVVLCGMSMVVPFSHCVEDDLMSFIYCPENHKVLCPYIQIIKFFE